MFLLLTMSTVLPLWPMARPNGNDIAARLTVEAFFLEELAVRMRRWTVCAIGDPAQRAGRMGRTRYRLAADRSPVLRMAHQTLGRITRGYRMQQTRRKRPGAGT